ncbi:MAG: CBS domain-containing protein [bacterium]|nr:CBS domain-containing protein [bacterium]
MTTVRDIIQRKGDRVYSTPREATALEAAREMNERRIGSLVVIEGERVVGIVTERDILRRVVAQGLDAAGVRVDRIMSTPVAVCHYATTLEECRAVMTDRRIRHLPVVEEGRLRGIIAIGDLMAHRITEHESTIEYLKEYLYSPPAPHGDTIVELPHPRAAAAP